MPRGATFSTIRPIRSLISLRSNTSSISSITFSSYRVGLYPRCVFTRFPHGLECERAYTLLVAGSQTLHRPCAYECLVEPILIVRVHRGVERGPQFPHETGPLSWHL